MCEPEMLVWVCVCVCVCLECRRAVSKREGVYLSFDAHESVSGSSRRCNKCHEGWDVVDIVAPEGGVLCWRML